MQQKQYLLICCLLLPTLSNLDLQKWKSRCQVPLTKVGMTTEIQHGWWKFTSSLVQEVLIITLKKEYHEGWTKFFIKAPSLLHKSDEMQHPNLKRQHEKTSYILHSPLLYGQLDNKNQILHNTLYKPFCWNTTYQLASL